MASFSLVLIVALFSLSCVEHGSVLAVNSTEPTPLYFLFMTSWSSSANTSGSLPAVDLALDMINGDSSFLPGYQLHYRALDSQCNRQVSLQAFFDEVLATENFTQYIALIGAGCSVATEPVAEVIPFYSMPMISYASSADKLTSREMYPTLFRTILAEETLVKAFTSLIHLHNWTQLAFITQKEEVFTSISAEVTRTVQPEGVHVVGRSFSSDEDPLEVSDLFVSQDNIRVFVVNMDQNFARRILCKAHHKRMVAPLYTWILYGWYNGRWWISDEDSLPDPEYNCTQADMLKTLNTSLALLPYPMLNRTRTTESGLTLDQFLNMYQSRQEAGDFLYTSYALFAFDAVWALGLALNASINMVSLGNDSGCSNSTSPLVPYENFTYSNDKLLCILRNSLQASGFHGVTGPIFFDENGNRAASQVMLRQYRVRNIFQTSNVIVTVGNVFNDTVFEFSEGEDLGTLWPNGIPPDGTPVDVISGRALALSVVLLLLSVAGIAFTMFCLLFNIVFRQRKVIQLTSPKLNYIMIMGAVLLYLSVTFIAFLPLEALLSTILCNAANLLFSIGNTMCFAVVLAKLGRVYYIFTAPSLDKKIIKDYHLLLAIVLIVGVDVMIVLVPVLIDHSRITASLTPDRELGIVNNNDGIPENHLFYHCDSSDNSRTISMGVSFAYKLLLQLIAVYFAFRTRNIEIEVLNDSKQTAAIVYITSLILIIATASSFTTDTCPNLFGAIVGIAIAVYPTVILGFTFIPKMIHLYRDPHGEAVFSGVSSPFTNAAIGLGTVSRDEGRMVALERKIRELEIKLSSYEQSAAHVQSEEGEGNSEVYVVLDITSEGPTHPATSEGPTQPATSGGPTQPATSGGPTQPANSGGPTQPANSGGPTQPVAAENTRQIENSTNTEVNTIH